MKKIKEWLAKVGWAIAVLAVFLVGYALYAIIGGGAFGLLALPFFVLFDDPTNRIIALIVVAIVSFFGFFIYQDRQAMKRQLERYQERDAERKKKDKEPW